MSDGRTRLEPPPLPQTRREDAAVPAVTRREDEVIGSHANRLTGARHLPSLLIEHGFSYGERLQSRGAEAALHLVLDANGQPFVLKVYNQGAPKWEVLERLRAIGSRHVNPLHYYEDSPDGFWELQAWAPEGSLRDLIIKEGPQFAPTHVEAILRELASALAAIHKENIEHRDLKPENVLIASRNPLQLSLIDFGIASVVEGTSHATQAASRTIFYAPPEAAVGLSEDEHNRKRLVFQKHAWDYWSLGIILVELLAGRHPFSGRELPNVMFRLVTGNPDDIVSGVADQRWRLLCRGLLRRNPENRWGGEQVERWLRRDTTLTVAAENPDAQAGLPPSLRFRGEQFSTPGALAESLAEHWKDAVDFWKLKAANIKDWVKNDLGEIDIAARLDAADHESVNDDGTLFRVIRALDPTMPPIFKDIVINKDGLARCVGDAAREAQAASKDRPAQAWISALEAARILAVADMPGTPATFGPLDAAWRKEIEAYNNLAKSMSGHVRDSGSLALTPDKRVVLLGALLPGTPSLANLRRHAQTAATADARACAWFRNLGDPSRASPATLLMMPFVAQRAAEETAAQRQVRRDANLRLVGQCIKYGSIPALIVIWMIYYNSPAQVAARQEEARRAEIARQQQERARQEQIWRQQEAERQRQEAERQRQLAEQQRRAQEEDFNRRCIRLANGQVQCCPPGQQVRQKLAPYYGGAARFIPYCR